MEELVAGVLKARVYGRRWLAEEKHARFLQQRRSDEHTLRCAAG